MPRLGYRPARLPCSRSFIVSFALIFLAMFLSFPSIRHGKAIVGKAIRKARIGRCASGGAPKTKDNTKSAKYSVISDSRAGPFFFHLAAPVAPSRLHQHSRRDSSLECVANHAGGRHHVQPKRGADVVKVLLGGQDTRVAKSRKGICGKAGPSEADLKSAR